MCWFHQSNRNVQEVSSQNRVYPNIAHGKTMCMNDIEVDMLQERTQTVLLFEADRSLRRLITLGLQSRGMRVIEASSFERIITLQSQHPDVVVLDIDGEAGSNYRLPSTLESYPYFSTIPLIVLTWDCLIPVGNQRLLAQTPMTCLAKPFDARTLHAAIEHIQDTGNGSNTASNQAQVLARRSVTPAPSIWPLITAAGLVLSLIGLMTQISVSAVGLLVILIALLLWTLGTKTESEPFAV
jgi:CheY-like chemotaxis protein